VSIREHLKKAYNANGLQYSTVDELLNNLPTEL